jgi:sRNA-binding protein
MVHQPADPNAVPWNRAREAEWWRAADELEASLRALAPVASGDVPTSLAIGIDRDITARMADAADEATISRFLARWTRRPAYVRAIAAGNVRRDLGGNPTGEAMAEQRESAAEHLAACGAA